MQKAAMHGNAIALVFARTDVKWFQDLAPTMDAVLFVSGRIRFYQGNIRNQGGTPGTGSMLIAWGEEAHNRLRNSGLGVLMVNDHD